MVRILLNCDFQKEDKGEIKEVEAVASMPLQLASSLCVALYLCASYVLCNTTSLSEVFVHHKVDSSYLQVGNGSMSSFLVDGNEKESWNRNAKSLKLDNDSLTV